MKVITNEIVKELNSSKNKCKAYQSDASVLVDCEKLVDDVLNDFGSIDVLINNAGIAKLGPVEHISSDEFDLHLKTWFRTSTVFKYFCHCLAQKTNVLLVK